MTTQVDRFRGHFDQEVGPGDLFLFTDKGDYSIWLMNPTATQDQRIGTGTSLPTLGPTWHEKAIAEFDSQLAGLSDILFQNDNGALALWQINDNTDNPGNVALTAVNFNLPNPGPGWSAVQANDFDGDSAADILFQNTNGQLAIWTFATVNGVPTRTGGLDVDQNPGASWHVATTGDVNNLDGEAGIVFQNTINGALAIWERRADVTATTSHFNDQANLPNPGPNWQALFLGDFNGDARADLLLQNSATGAVAIWTLGAGQQNLGVFGAYDIAGTAANGPAWHVVAVQDQTGDDRPDIIFQNSNTGAGAVWSGFTPAADGSGTATFAQQFDVAPNPNPTGHLDWHIV